MRVVWVSGFQKSLAYQSYPGAYVMGPEGLAQDESYSGQEVVIWDPADQVRAPGIIEFFEDVGNVRLLFMAVPHPDDPLRPRSDCNKGS